MKILDFLSVMKQQVGLLTKWSQRDRVGGTVMSVANKKKKKKKMGPERVLRLVSGEPLECHPE